MRVLVLSFVLCFLGVAFAEAKKQSSIGADAASGVETAIKNLQESSKKKMPVVVKGKIGSVCQAKGCWLTLRPTSGKKSGDVCTETLKGASSQADVRVMFGDHAFTVPKKLKGEVTVIGEMEKKKLSSFQLKHLLKDAGCSKSQMKKVKNGLYKYQIVASKVLKNGKVYQAK